MVRREHARTSSGSSCSARAVEPTRSAKTTVTTFRSSRRTTGASAVPHDAQKRSPSGLSRPQRVQTITCARVYDAAALDARPTQVLASVRSTCTARYRIIDRGGRRELDSPHAAGDRGLQRDRQGPRRLHPRPLAAAEQLGSVGRGVRGGRLRAAHARLAGRPGDRRRGEREPRGLRAQDGRARSPTTTPR